MQRVGTLTSPPPDRPGRGLTGRPGGGAEPYQWPVTDLKVAWDDLHDAKPDGWYVGPPT